MPPTTKFMSSGSVSSAKAMTVDFINVGQGNAVLVSFPNGKFLLVDCGSQKTSLSGKPFTHARDYITKVTNGSQIDTVVITHGDTDHTAFIPYLQETKSPEYVFYGGKRSHLDADVLKWIQGLEKTKKNVFYYNKNYSSLAPDAEYGSPTNDGEPEVYTLSANFDGGDPNSNSVVLLIVYGSQGVLLTGDADVSTENFIIQNIPKVILKRCTLFMLAHHGSYYSTGQAFLDIITPNFSTVSASGTNKAYAHPDCIIMGMLSKKVLDGAINHGVICSDGKNLPYKKSNTTKAIITTATNGDIRYVTDGTNYKILASSTNTNRFMMPMEERAISIKENKKSPNYHI
ncbi:ComEC/Rec2 family competence protein [Psychroserpens sp. SPM9]|uniref:ComEC/Rec2 family competence protein n=1 Tax=Psychroserpens sp. SPM9 TaxID=2975598 RepID=UPI0021A4503C|nr:MBL fold metallo-hydrolase [Psychroserpens sp. SPM9]MDG5490535.1 MBL fold metallo-hydrolase [Psychroserpens sp. SPM9]